MPPSTTKMTSDQFAQTIKAKYPAYDNIDNATLVQKVLAKYPVYADKVDMGSGIGGPTSNQGLPGSHAFAGPGSTKSPLQQIGDFATKALPVGGAILGGIAGGALGGLAASPTVFGIPAGAYAGGVIGAGLGAAGGTSAQEALQGKAQDPTQIAKTGAEYSALEAIGGPAISLAGKGLEAAGKGIAQMFIPKSTVEASMLQTYKAGTSLFDRIGTFLSGGKSSAPTTAASTAFEKGLVGTESMIGVQAKKAQTKIWDNLIGPALKQSKVEVDIPGFLSQAEKKIVSETNDPTRQKVLLNALNSIKEDFSDVGKITVEQLQKYKEGWAEFVPEKAYKGESISGALNDVRNTLAGMAREKIYTSLGDNVKQAYLDYGNLNAIKALGVKAMTGAVKGGTGTTLKNLWEMATVPVGTIAGQTIYKVGQLGELIGSSGARIVRDILASPALGPNQTQSSTTQSTSTPPTQ